MRRGKHLKTNGRAEQMVILKQQHKTSLGNPSRMTGERKEKGFHTRPAAALGRGQRRPGLGRHARVF